MVSGKGGLIRILEATIAVMLVAGVLLVAYTKQQSASSDSREYIYNLQRKVLEDINLRSDLRDSVIRSNESSVDSVLIDYVSSQIPSNFEYSVRVCKLTSPPTPCKMNPDEFISAGDADVYVEETLISANLSQYDPKRVRLFVWEVE